MQFISQKIKEAFDQNLNIKNYSISSTEFSKVIKIHMYILFVKIQKDVELNYFDLRCNLFMFINSFMQIKEQIYSSKQIKEQISSLELASSDEVSECM